MTRQGRPPAVPKSSELPLQQQHCRCCYIINYIDMTITMIHRIKIGYIPYTMFRCMGLNIITSIISEYVTLRPQYIFYQCCITANRANRAIGLRDSTIRPQKVDSNCKFAKNLYLIHNTVCSDLDLSHGNKEVCLALYFCLQINFLRK